MFVQFAHPRLNAMGIVWTLIQRCVRTGGDRKIWQILNLLVYYREHATRFAAFLSRDPSWGPGPSNDTMWRVNIGFLTRRSNRGDNLLCWLVVLWEFFCRRTCNLALETIIICDCVLFINKTTTEIKEKCFA